MSLSELAAIDNGEFVEIDENCLSALTMRRRDAHVSAPGTVFPSGFQTAGATK